LHAKLDGISLKLQRAFIQEENQALPMNFLGVGLTSARWLARNGFKTSDSTNTNWGFVTNDTGRMGYCKKSQNNMQLLDVAWI
jgi:hypothetical protein